MTILVTGGTGSVGSFLVPELQQRGASVRVLSRKRPEIGKIPDGVEVAAGEMLDPVFLERTLEGVDKLFLLNAVAAEELTQALITFGVAKSKGIKHITYLSVLQAERFPDVPHFASKLPVEAAIREAGVPYTFLRPGYYFQNDGMLKGAIAGGGLYPMPIGTKGISAVDVRDIAEAAAVSLTTEGHEGQAYDAVSPELISGPSNAAVWSKLLSKEVRYTGHNFNHFEEHMRSMMEPWKAFDLRKMFEGFFERGFASTDGEVSRFAELLGHAPRTYEEFAKEIAGQWNAQKESK